MNTIIKQSIFLAVIGLVITSLVFISCRNSPITSDNKAPAERDSAEMASIDPDNFLDPGDILPDIEDLDLEKFLVETNTGLKPVVFSAGNTSSTGYSIIDLGTLSSDHRHHSFGRGINNNSQATGYSNTSSGSRAFLWENNSMQSIGTLNSSNYHHSYGQDINNHGQIAGHSYVGDMYHAFLWDATTGMQDLGALTGAIYSTATAINDKGQVVGYSRTSSGYRGFIWDATSGMQDLGTINGATLLIPLGTNNNGVIVGYYRNSSGLQAFKWDATNGITDLGTLGVTPSSSRYVIPRDINDLGQITGNAANLNGHSRGGFIWDPDTGFQSLGSVPGAGSNFLSYGLSLNNNGQVTGFFSDYRNNEFIRQRAFVWDAANGMQDLGVLDQNSTRYYNFSIARDINDKGEIIGRSANKDGRMRAVIWNNATNNPPVADAGPDQTLECEGGLTCATLDGSSSSDPDDDPLTYSWSLNGSEIATGVTPAVELSLGTHTITLTVSDPDGETDSDNVVINVVDTIPPELAYTVENTELWPPNHKMKMVVSGVSITDICDPNPVLAIDVKSNDAVNGRGDGNTDPDWNIVDNGDGTYDVFVRAERSGNGDGRFYTITLTGTDASGNITEEIVKVSVPHSKGNGRSR